MTGAADVDGEHWVGVYSASDDTFPDGGDSIEMPAKLAGSRLTASGQPGRWRVAIPSTKA